jgi:hypothetical protein
MSLTLDWSSSKQDNWSDAPAENIVGAHDNKVQFTIAIVNTFYQEHIPEKLVTAIDAPQHSIFVHPNSIGLTAQKRLMLDLVSRW